MPVTQLCLLKMNSDSCSIKLSTKHVMGIDGILKYLRNPNHFLPFCLTGFCIYTRNADGSCFYIWKVCWSFPLLQGKRVLVLCRVPELEITYALSMKGQFTSILTPSLSYNSKLCSYQQKALKISRVGVMAERNIKIF